MVERGAGVGGDGGLGAGEEGKGEGGEERRGGDLAIDGRGGVGGAASATASAEMAAEVSRATSRSCASASRARVSARPSAAARVEGSAASPRTRRGGRPAGRRDAERAARAGRDVVASATGAERMTMVIVRVRVAGWRASPWPPPRYRPRACALVALAGASDIFRDVVAFS